MLPVRYAAPDPAKGPTPLARVFRVLIVLGVWMLVGLAGLAAWVRLVA